MSNFKIIQELGRWSLYQNGVLFNTYSRKDSAVRRMRKLQAAEVDLELFESDETTSSDSKGSVFRESQNTASISVFLNKSPLNKACRLTAEALYGTNFILSVFDAVSNVPLKVGAVQPHTPTQRTFVRGAAGAAARSPP